METKEYYGGLYPETPEQEEYQTVKVECSFTTYILVPKKLDEYDEIKNYIYDNCDKYDFMEEADKINIEDIN